MTQSVFITGNSSGLGYGLTEEYLSRGYEVYGLSRRGCTGIDNKALHDVNCDLSLATEIVPALESLLGEVSRLNLVFLNAGVLGEIRKITETPLVDILHVMDINVWANKIILDWLHTRELGIEQIVSISSGAAVKSHKGWGAYSLSKATLNMLNQLYAPEYPDTHLCALAPGLVDTEMQDHLCNPDEVDVDQYPSVQKLRDARGTDSMPKPRAAAHRLAQVISKLKDYPSGSYVDVRTMNTAP
jgi:NAD(P)-dependent dehydrogenase (short-subunit alcohol dehydrogenase family)